MSIALARYTHTKFLACYAGGYQGRKRICIRPIAKRRSDRTNVIDSQKGYSRHSEMEIALFGTDS